MSPSPLPPGFESLEPFAARWALDTQNERVARRRASSREELESFFNAVFPHIERILAACDRFPLGELPASHRPLFSMALSVAEVAPHVELYRGSAAVPHSFDETRLVAAHGDHPTWQNLPPSTRGHTR